MPSKKYFGIHDKDDLKGVVFFESLSDLVLVLSFVKDEHPGMILSLVAYEPSAEEIAAGLEI
jgi:hypothetical protein